MFTDSDVKTVATYFGVFNPSPPVALDTKQNDEGESYILIEGGGLSIGKHKNPPEPPSSPRKLGRKPTHTFLVYDHNGEDDGNEYKDLGSAIKGAMQAYSAEMFRRVNDKLATAAQAEDFALQRSEKDFGAV